MAEVIRMPKLSDTMEEGILATWLKKEGETVKEGELLAEVETDKATMDLEAYTDGTLLHIGAQERDSVPINSIIAIIGEPGEDISELLVEDTKNSSAIEPLASLNASAEKLSSAKAPEPATQPS
ncbi:MAG: biotin/lipoyl-containing protein, partial [Bacteroidota bacterium]